MDHYVAGLPPEWTGVDRTEDLGYGDTLNAQAKFRQGDTSNGIGIQVYADVWGRSATVILMILALNCGEDVPGFPPVRLAGWGRFSACFRQGASPND